MGKIVGAGSLIVDVTAYAHRLPVDGETSLGVVLNSDRAVKATIR